MATRGQRGRSRAHGGRKGRGGQGGGGSRGERGRGGGGSAARDVSLAVARGRLKARKKAERARKLEILKAEKDAQQKVAQQRTLAIRSWHKEEKRREAEEKKRKRESSGKLGTVAAGGEKGEGGGGEEGEEGGECEGKRRRVSFSGTMMVTNIPSNCASDLPSPVRSPLQPLNAGGEDDASGGASDESDEEEDDPTFVPNRRKFSSLFADEDGVDLEVSSDEEPAAAEAGGTAGRRKSARLDALGEEGQSDRSSSDSGGGSGDDSGDESGDGRGDGSEEDASQSDGAVGTNGGCNLDSVGKKNTQRLGAVGATAEHALAGKRSRVAQKDEDETSSPGEISHRAGKKKRRLNLSPGVCVGVSSGDSSTAKATESGSRSEASVKRKVGKGKPEATTPPAKRKGESGTRGMVKAARVDSRYVAQGPGSAAAIPSDPTADGIDCLFAGMKKKKESAPANAGAPEGSERLDGEDGTLLWGKATGSGKQRFTKDGLRILSGDDIKAENQGVALNGDCPFDCSCCF